MGNFPSLPMDISCPAASNSGLYSIGNALFSPQCGYDTTGPTLHVVETNFYNCITTCADDGECAAVSYNNGVCYQKSSIGQLIPSDHVSSFTAAFAPTTPSDIACPSSDGHGYRDFTIQCGIDYPGVGDIGATDESSFANCMDTCSSTQGCVAVAYSGTGCYLKNKIGAPVANAGLRGAVLSSLPPYVPDTPTEGTGLSCPAADGKTIDGFLIACEQDYFGGDLSNLHTDTFSDCVAACAGDDNCVDVAWNHGACYLKDRLTSLQPAGGVWNAKKLNPKVSTPSPVDTPNCPADDGTNYPAGNEVFTIHCYADYAGGDYKSLATEKFSGCLAACAEDVECIDVAWNHGSCYLKSSLTSAVDNQNVWGAIKVVNNVPSLNTLSSPSNTTIEVERVRRHMNRRSVR